MNKTKWKIAFLSLLLLAFALGFLVLAYRQFYFSAFVLFAFAAFLLYELNATITRILNSTEQVLAGIAMEDYSLKLSSKQLPDRIYAPLEQILDNQKKQNQENQSLKIIYENIIDSIDTGILILKQTKANDIEIFYSNMAFSNLLELPKYTHWRLLKPHLKTFESYLEVERWRDQKDVVTLSINGKEQVFSLRTFLTRVYNEPYLILNLDTLQSIIDKKEKESWYNLMKVMSHEILNTIAPISSLSNNLEYLIEERRDELGEDFEDIQKSVQTIQQRTQHLSDFVNTYRALTELPSPRKERVKIDTLIENSLTTLSALLEENNIQINLKIHPDAQYFFVDAKQIEQVLINLITNAIYAVQKIETPQIWIRTFTTNIKNCIEVIDNGQGIPEEIKPDIFIPFFTTRENGSGIGLSLSKNIIQAHDGHINFTSESKTSFVLQLPKV